MARRRADSVIAIALAAIVATIAPGLVVPGPFRGGAVFFAALHVLALGLPVFLWLGRPISWWKSCLCGALIASVPLSLLVLLLDSGDSSVGDVATMIDGVRTFAGWLRFTMMFLSLCALGVVAGLGFWLVLLVTNSGLLAPKHERIVAVSLYLSVVLLIVGATFQAKSSQDRSCHNLFRDGGKTFLPTVSIDLDVPDDEWATLTRLFEAFGEKHQLQFKNSSEEYSHVRTLYLSLCNEAGAVITTAEQRWVSEKNEWAPSKTRGVYISAYDGRPASNSLQLARLLIAELEKKWPDAVRFRDGGGELIPKPDVLQ
jgi:hypothetical protein